MKNKPDPVAMEDHEYPDWLWEALRSKQEAAGAEEGVGDLFCTFDCAITWSMLLGDGY